MGMERIKHTVRFLTPAFLGAAEQNMERIKHTVSFLTPAFLGDAEQNAVWRSPPFKAELRRWWRMAMIARTGSLGELRSIEGCLFGDAAGADGRRSAVRLRLHGQRAWKPGSLRTWPGVRSSQQGVAADLYLGYGPIQYSKESRKPELGKGCAIDAGEAVNLSLAWPTGTRGSEALLEALGLMHQFGTLGSRSRNGWGSYQLDPVPACDLAAHAADWRDVIVNVSWPRHIGRDEKGLLIWRTAPCSDWKAVIGILGDVRKQLCRESGALRPLMSSPVTGRSQPKWTDGARVPNTLRFKVIANEQGQLVGQVTHMPCRPADELWNCLEGKARRQFPELWQSAHAQLDQTLQRVEP